jgi:hypothetical protein
MRINEENFPKSISSVCCCDQQSINPRKNQFVIFYFDSESCQEAFYFLLMTLSEGLSRRYLAIAVFVEEADNLFDNFNGGTSFNRVKTLSDDQSKHGGKLLGPPQGW